MLGVLNQRISVGYVPVPKVANTSIKHMMYHLEFGESFFQTKKRHEADGTSFDFQHIHAFYRKNMVDTSSADFRFVVVRDPIKRFLSAFSNRVEHHRELSNEKIEALSPGKKKKFLNRDFVFDPTLAQFIDRLDVFLRVPSMRVHMSPAMELTGDLGNYTNVYRLEEISKMQDDLSQFVGTEIKLGRMQTGGRKIPVSELSERSLNILLEYYRDEYANLGGLYKSDDIIADWKNGK